ncbi:hypothetical protein TOT_030000255 [Theileria orientalis strain Shintoku]|uniref:Uncharacterized protein n=1 Tax=Theileria orientalis strain Shintoku TaxID=869250 RepID=J4DPN1_THEOR|nr:hypothetical protein TOT_030000255 [Theileria orientalis strain Shintoku]BAM40994.1 hypothetical protein TOT_030000255 [Theileria orientalis strain Shintoku]|eukprot:XP_009691295.1 hypothetical protein TOT_030000255 [Theileria orientalis strain Shintoku]
MGVTFTLYRTGNCPYMLKIFRVVVFGLDRSHEIIESISNGAQKDDMKVVYSDKLLSNIYTESRAKRRRNRRFKLSHICSISTSGSTYKVKLPEELSNLEVIETNTRLTSEPELLSTEVLLKQM